MTGTGKRVLMVAGGWEGHEPRQCAEIFAGVLRGDGFEVTMRDTLDAYLDEALLGGLDSVAIIHGFGTGALRSAVRDALAEHPRVRGVRSGRREEGGDGTTVAEL
jgi:dsDNA-specific endonuclease/ATPase MutS2